MKLGSDETTERFRAELRAWQKRLFDTGWLVSEIQRNIIAQRVLRLPRS